MDVIIKTIVKKVSKCDVSKPIDSFGNIISPILFKTDKAGIFVDRDRHKVCVLLPDSIKEKDRQQYILKIVELLGVLENLEREYLVYVQSNNENGVEVYYEGKTCFGSGQIPNTYKISQDETMSVVDEETVILKKGNKTILSSIPITTQVAFKLERYLCGRLFPTSSLIDFVKRGFKTRENRNTQLGLRYSVVSMVIAVLIATVSPFLSVMISNRIGVATLNQVQMDSLLKTARPVYLIQQDTVKAVCR